MVHPHLFKPFCSVYYDIRLQGRHDCLPKHQENTKQDQSKNITLNKDTSHFDKQTCHRKIIPAAICLLTIVVFGAFIVSGGSSKTIVYASSVNGLGTGIYWDQACTNRTLSLPWGSVESGSNTTLTYLH